MSKIIHMLPVTENEDEKQRALWILSRPFPKGGKKHLPKGEAVFDEDVGAWILTDDGAEKFVKRMKASFCGKCDSGEPCEESDYPEEITEYYEIDVGDDDEDDVAVEMLEKFYEKGAKVLDEFLKYLSEELPGGAPTVNQAAAAAAVLGITLPATKEVIDEAFKKAALKHHPDRGGSPEEMKKVLEARKILLAQAA